MKKCSLPLSNAVITLYNRVETTVLAHRTSVSWVRRVLSGCMYRLTSSSDESNGVISRPVSAVIEIPADTDYVSKEDWDALADRSGKFTLATGDIIVPGEVFDVLTGDATGRSILTKYRKRGAVTVNRVCDRASEGEPMGHYAVWGD